MSVKSFGAHCYFCGDIHLTSFNWHKEGVKCMRCGKQNVYASGGYIPGGWELVPIPKAEVSVGGNPDHSEGTNVPSD